MTDRQRIDKWLWHARVVRTRPAAAGLATSGRVRVNGVRVLKPSAARPNDGISNALLRQALDWAQAGDAEAARSGLEAAVAANP